MKKVNFWMVLAILSLGLFVACSDGGSSSDGGDGGDTGDPTFTGTWLRVVSATESMQYVYKDDGTFVYTWLTNGQTMVYAGTYTYDEAALTYQETVETQTVDDDPPILGGWETNYTYTLSATELTFDDGNGYTPTFTKQ